MRILVVEDERLLCDGIAEDLRLEKYTVDCCYDGPAASFPRPDQFPPRKCLP